ncbi:MAG: SHOCT domain-containing protein [Hyphomonadaceae bacterium]|nr:SHOCT domain-containing protein [Hyphomonadaceae bacterium]
MSIAEEIKKLNELREQGVITDAEFEQQKGLLLSGASAAAASQAQPLAQANGLALAWAEVKLKNKWWFQGLLTFVIPLAGLIFLFMKSYQKSRKGETKRVGVWFKLFFLTAVVFVWASILARPQGGADFSGGETSAIGATADLLPECGSADARALIDDAIANNAANNIATLRLLDVIEVTEISATENERRCNATLLLNSGRERVGYRMFPSSDRSMLLVEVGQPYANTPPPAPPSAAPATPTQSEQSSNVDFDRVRQSALTRDEQIIVENVCAVPEEQRLDQFSIAQLSYSGFCIDDPAP